MTRPNQLWGSNGVAFGPDGRLYVAQYLGAQISAVDLSSGDVEIVVSPAGPVRSPDDLAFGPDGSMYITDLVPGRVWRRTPQGEFVLVSDQLAVPNGITCVGDRLFVNEMRMHGRLVELFPDGGEPVVLTDDLVVGNAMQLGPDGKLYYPHMFTDQVFRISPDGGAPELVASEVHEPVAVRFDQGGVLTVLSRGVEGIVTRIDLFGTGDRSIVTSGIKGLDNAAFDAENRMFVSSFASGGIAELHPDGRTTEIVPQGLDGPFGVAVGGDGTVYAADHYRLASPESAEADSTSAASGTEPGGVLTREMLIFAHGIAEDGGLLHITSQFGDVRTYDPADRSVRMRADRLDQPMGLAVRADGVLVVAEAGAGRILAIDAQDAVTVLAAGLTHPVDVAFDERQRLYVSEDRRGRVLRIDGDEIVVIAEDLGAPQGLAVRGAELFVVETAHGRILEIDLADGGRRIEAEDLPVCRPDAEPPVFSHGMPGLPPRFAGLAVARDGTLYLSANGEGSVLRLAAGQAADAELPPG